MAEISQRTKKLIEEYRRWHQSRRLKEGLPTIHVDEVASAVAAFYEKIRGVVDWQEEHLLRKRAIERILKRRLLLNKNGEEIGASLVLELIRGGHFPNDFIPETKIGEVQKLIDKYVFILENSPPATAKKSKTEFYDWILGIAACELEEVLSPPIKEKALIDYMTELLKERIKVIEGIFVVGGLSEQDINAQIYIAVQRALFRLDPHIISYNLLKMKYPGDEPSAHLDASLPPQKRGGSSRDWSNLPMPLLKEITENIYSIWEKIEKDLNHPLADKFYKICEKYDTPYLILNDIIFENPSEAENIISQPETLEGRVRQAYNKRASTIKSRLSRAAFYATLSIFITNVFSLYIIEFPLAKLLWGHFTPVSMAINVFAPTLLMFFLIATIKLPPKENIEVTAMETAKIVYEGKRKDVYEIKIYPKRGFITKTIITLFYIAGFSLSCGIISWGLSKIEFPPTSHVIFIVFISLIAFAGMRIRQRVKEIEIIERRENFLYFFVDFFAVPITHFGKWLSLRWQRINIVSKFFSLLIDMPFQVFVEFLEQWRYFLKEKREGIH